MEDSATMLARVVRVVFLGALVAAVAVPACGGSSDDSSSSTAGSGGSAGKGSGGSSGSVSRAGNGGASTNPPVSCGKNSCNGVDIAIPGAPSLTIPACCSDEATSKCGLDSSFLAMFGPTFDVACQPLEQPGTLDKSCADSPKTPVTGTQVSINFPGCCRANGTCGYELESLGGLFHLGLGCVDSTPFLDGGTPASCGAGQGGAGGEGPTGVAGAPMSGGAGGETASGGAAGN